MLSGTKSFSFLKWSALLWCAFFCALTSTCALDERQNYLGVEYLDVQDAEHGGPGALVTAVVPCSCAATTGLRIGDVITAVGNRAVNGESLGNVLKSLPLNEHVSLSVRRGSEKVSLSATLQTVGTKFRPRLVPYSGIGSWKRGAGPLIVTCVEPGSPMEKGGLLGNDVITAIGGSAVTSDTFEDILSALGAGTTVPVETVRQGKSYRFTVTLNEFTAAPERLIVRGVSNLSSTVGDVIDIESIPLNNCYGSDVMERARSVTKRTTSKFDLGLHADLKAFGFLPFILAENRVTAALDAGETKELAETKGETLKAKPGTFTNYRIKWYLQSTRGMVSIDTNGKTYEVPFTLADRLRSEVESLPATPCKR